jgi:hypothetical protein
MAYTVIKHHLHTLISLLMPYMVLSTYNKNLVTKLYLFLVHSHFQGNVLSLKTSQEQLFTSLNMGREIFYFNKNIYLQHI